MYILPFALNSLVPPATTLLSWLHSRTPQTTVWICFNSFHPNPDPLSFSLSTTSMPLTLAIVVGRPSRILMPSPPSLLTLRALTTVAVHRVPSLSLIYGNEIADLLAKRGADGTTCSSMPDVPTLIDIRLQRNRPPLVSIPVSSLSVFAFANCL